MKSKIEALINDTICKVISLTTIDKETSTEFAASLFAQLCLIHCASHRQVDSMMEKFRQIVAKEISQVIPPPDRSSSHILSRSFNYPPVAGHISLEADFFRQMGTSEAEVEDALNKIVDEMQLMSVKLQGLKAMKEHYERTAR